MGQRDGLFAIRLLLHRYTSHLFLLYAAEPPQMHVLVSKQDKSPEWLLMWVDLEI